MTRMSEQQYADYMRRMERKTPSVQSLQTPPPTDAELTLPQQPTRVFDAAEFIAAPYQWLRKKHQIQYDSEEPREYALEEHLQWNICKHLRHLGAWANVVDAGSKSQTNRARAGRVPTGFPDIICIRDGWLVLLEVKMPNGVFTEYQKIQIPELVRHGAVVHVVHSLREAREAVWL